MGRQRIWWCALVALVWTAAITARIFAAEIALSPADGSPRVVIVRGLSKTAFEEFDRISPEKRQLAMQVRVVDAPESAPAVLGQVSRRGTDLVFVPRYPLQAGLKYRVRFDGAELKIAGLAVESELLIPAPPSEPTIRVEAIYPSAEQLPENLLRFYIHFTGPMSRGEAYEHIRLIDDKGQIVSKPFLEVEEELWNPQMTRFTLLFDPGRIKHGLVSQMQLGPPLTNGHTYKLVIDAGWHDAEGRPLVQPNSKTFHTTPAETRGTDPSRWKLSSVEAGTSNALNVELDKALDHAMLQRVVTVRDPQGRLVVGKITVSEHEQHWSFKPESTWRAGRYALSVETILEDPSGNSIALPFEVDMNRRSNGPAPQTVEIPFSVSEASRP